MKEKLKAAVIGAGHMGRHHMRVYSELDDVELLAVVDTDLSKAEEYSRRYKCQAFSDVADVIGKVDIASVATPTVSHLKVAQILIENGIHVLIEKPLAKDTDEGRKIIELAKKHGVVVQVGHTERFNPVVEAIHKFEVTPQFIETHRISPFTFRSADIGVVFDIMIHDIDVVLSLVKSKVDKVDAVGVAVLGRNEDIANARLIFENGCVANLTASRLALKTERKIRVFSQEAYLSLDYQKRTGIIIKKSSNLDFLRLARERGLNDLAEVAGMDYSKLVKVEPLMLPDEEPLKAEVEDFIMAVRTGRMPKVPVEAGYAAIEVAERIVKSIKGHAWALDV